MTVRELIGKLLTDPNINFDQKIALGTKDGCWSNFGYILFHIVDINNLNDCVNVLWFEDPRHKKETENERPQGEWARHDEWVNGEYIGGFYHINCPCDDGYYSKWRTNFCPNCGLPMNKDEKESENEHITPSSDDTM